MKLDFLKNFDNPLSKYLIYKRFECIGYTSCDLLKLNGGLGLVYVEQFQQIFLWKCFLILYQLTMFQYQNFVTSQDIKQFVFYIPVYTPDHIMSFRICV